MNLPSYFLADLPAEATLTPVMISEACQALKRNRERYLLARSTQSLVKVLSEVAEGWLDPEYPFRKLALDQGPDATGFSRATLAGGLETFFGKLTAENLNALLHHELGHPQRLDQMVATPAEEKARLAAMASGPELLAHIAPGNVPNPALMSMVMGALARSAQFVKCARRAAFLPRLFAHSIYDADPKLAACLEVAEWRGGELSLETALFNEADCVAATGSDEMLVEVRQRLPPKVRFLGYGSRVSFGYISSEVLAGFGMKKIVARAASDVVAWDQLGCLSPHLFYVEHGGEVSAEGFAELLAQELAKREAAEPRGQIPIETSALIAAKRDFYQVRAAHSPETRLWASENSTAWTVVYEASARFQLSCLHRFIYVKGVNGLADALQNADSVRGQVSTVGLAAPEENADEMAGQLARWGVTRVCPLGQMQNPPLTWRHDGRPSLGDLVTWADWER